MADPGQQLDDRPQAKPAAEREVWTAEDVADYLRCTTRHVTNLARNGIIKGKQFGSIWRFKRQDIENSFE